MNFADQGGNRSDTVSPSWVSRSVLLSHWRLSPRYRSGARVNGLRDDGHVNSDDVAEARRVLRNLVAKIEGGELDASPLALARLSQTRK